jgi:hypothetical protein
VKPTCGAEEFEPGGGGEEEVAEFHDRAFRQRGRLHRGHPAALAGDLGGVPFGAGGDGQAPHGTKRGQRLTPEAEAADIQKVRPVDLRRRMAREGQGQVLCRHAAAVVRHPDQRLAAIGNVHLNPRRTGVQRVLHQLFHRAGRTFHHLARRDAVDRGLIQLPDHRTALGARYLGGVKCHAPICSRRP